jgi:hypothetical protein
MYVVMIDELTGETWYGHADGLARPLAIVPTGDRPCGSVGVDRDGREDGEGGGWGCH